MLTIFYKKIIFSTNKLSPTCIFIKYVPLGKEEISMSVEFFVMSNSIILYPSILYTSICLFSLDSVNMYKVNIPLLGLGKILTLFFYSDDAKLFSKF